MKFPRVAIIVSVLALGAVPAFAQVNIDTRPAASGTAAPFGPPNTQTYGQTFTTTDVALVTSFVFRASCTDPTTARGHIYAWDSVNNHATGPSAFDSAPISLTADGTFHDLTVNTGVVVLPVGTYVVFMSTSEDAQSGSACQFQTADDTTYAGGTFVYTNNGTDTSQWTGNAWTTTFGSDAAFAVFFAGSAVPTMPEWILMVLIAATTLTATWTLRRRASPLHLSR